MNKIGLKNEWILSCIDTGETLPVTIPTDNYSAWLSAGRIPDPFHGLNEEEVQWLADKEWLFTRDFNLTEEFTQLPSVILNCDSLDTFAEIRLNGKHVANTENMFARSSFEVKNFLKTGRNNLSIRFYPAQVRAEMAASRYPFFVPYSAGNNKVPYMNHVRKVQCHAGWDWGICLLVSGIYGDVYLEGTSFLRIEYITTRQFHSRGACLLQVNIEAESVKEGGTEVVIKLNDITMRQDAEIIRGRNTITCNLSVDNPELWWPAGHGAQHLYDLTVTVDDREWKERIGLRRLDIINSAEDGRKGAPLVFRINRRDIFCKGANFIPIDAMPGRMHGETYRDLLESAVEANMNMLRVWGGGQYERDIFYNLCDEMGIMVWQDFMFSCSLYPANEEFLANVEKEVSHQVRRLMNHPSLVLWCGNNEVIQALDWYEESRKDKDRYRKDYYALNELLRKTVCGADPDRGFWPASPSKGPGIPDPENLDPAFGDTHYWEVWFKRVPFETYYRIKPRFVSEFGFQSFPSFECVKTYADEGQRDLLSPVMKFHQRHPEGNEKILEMMERYFETPSGLEDTIWLAQVQQGLAIRTAVEYFRSLRPYCMGTLYWQLNDLWPVCSWSSIEYGGKWKLLHYFARRFYEEAILTARKTGDAFELFLVSDRAQSGFYEITLEILSFDNRLLFIQNHSLYMEGPGVNNFTRFDPKNLEAGMNDCFMLLTLNDGRKRTENTFFFNEYKRALIKKPVITAHTEEEQGEIDVFLSTDAPAFFVTLNFPGIRGEFTDNVFTLLPQRSRAVRFIPKQPLDEADRPLKIEIRHL